MSDETVADSAVTDLIASYIAKEGNASLGQLLSLGYSQKIAEALPIAWLNPRVQRILRRAAEIAIRYDHSIHWLRAPSPRHY